MFYDVMNTVFDELRKKNQKRKDWQYKELITTPYLFSSAYLNELLEKADNHEDYETILDHLYRHDAMYLRDEEGEIVDTVPSYQKIEKHIIDKYWG